MKHFLNTNILLYKKMAEIKPVSAIIEEISPYYQERKKKKESGLIDSVPETEHTLVYESYKESLEPIYYFILDLMNDFGLKTEKLIDNFSPTPGSTQFSEMGTRATAMQQHASKVLGDVNTVLRSVLNIIYDLKDFRLRLQTYDDLKNPEKKDAALLSLKQIWMDKVDINKGNSSIKAMAMQQAGFVTLINAFLAAKDVKDITHNLDLNDVVKRVLIPRMQEFEYWVKQSEQELRKRYELEKNYLRSQVSSLKLYSRWAKPYLLAAQQLEQKISKNAALVKSFNRTILELTLLGKTEARPEKEILEETKKIPHRKYYSCILIDFIFRAVPAQANFIGRADVVFRAYSLNEDELKKLQQELDKSDVSDVLKLIEGTTEESLEKLQDEINFFLEEKPEEEAQAKSSDESNPFFALFGVYGKKTEKKQETATEDKEIEVKSDTWVEKEHYRKAAAETAAEMAFNLFDVYKKAHGMVSYT